MDGLSLLRELARHRDQAAEDEQMPPDALRFIVEYEAAIDLESERARIADVVGTDGFELQALFDDQADDDDEFGVFYVLQFVGLDRTMGQPELFSIAHALQDHLGAVTVEPDLGTEIYQEPVEPGSAAEEAVGDIFGGLCFVDGEPPADRQWALQTMRVQEAWNFSAARGEGVRIGQPDTGVTDHPELLGSVSVDQYSVFTGQNDATDPLQSGNTGHGTGTGSVATSREPGDIIGPAPAAELVPIRCIESVVIKFNAGPVAKAIDYARTNNCHIVTMSLGGTPSRAVKKAVKKAVADDLIVLAAAGNCVGAVVWPARYDDVIAVAGSNVHDGTWRGSSQGGSVDITAPGEKVWKAVTSDDGSTTVSGGQGTSFAVALTAGVAALWLSHHGRDAVIAAARAAGTTVQRLFREVLTTTARTPPGWDTGDFGAGVVDARALLAHPLPGAVPAPVESAGSASRGLVAEVFGHAAGAEIEAATTPQLDLEISALLLDDAGRGIDGSVPLAPETAMARLPASRRLREALGPSRLGLLGQRPEATARNVASMLVTSIRSPDPAALIAPSISGLESTAGTSVEDARAALRSGADDRVDRLRSVVGDDDQASRGVGPGVRSELIDDSRVVIDLVASGRAIPNESRLRAALEALVSLDGRPAIRLADGIDLNDELLGDWQGRLTIFSELIAERQLSIGRIDAVPGAHSGTGFVVGDGLVLTNRHVIEALAIPVPHADNPTGWIIPNDPTINFAADGVDSAHRYAIEEVVFAGPTAIEGAVDLANLDAALLRVRTTNEAGTAFPAPLPLSADPLAAVEGRNLFVIGYPAVPAVLPTDLEGNLQMDVVHRLKEIYGTRFGEKYLSPGLVMEASDQVADSPNHWVFSHDATSLGGNSGSCVLEADNDLSVVGLHFAGDWLRANYAHEMAKLIDALKPHLS